jgi:hypothetical protein
VADEVDRNVAATARGVSRRTAHAAKAGDDASEPVVVTSVIISTYNAREVVADCLASIYRNPPSELYEIIVVVDASSDGTSEMVRARFPEVQLLIYEVNLHYTRANNNRALDHARGESCGGEVVCAFGWGEGGEQLADLVPEAIDGSLGGFSKQRSELG